MAPPKHYLGFFFSLLVGKQRKGKMRTSVFKTEILHNPNLATGKAQITTQHLHFCPSGKRNYRVQPSSSCENSAAQTLCQPPEDQHNPRLLLSPQLLPLPFFFSSRFFFVHFGKLILSNAMVIVITVEWSLNFKTYILSRKWFSLKEVSTCR